MKVYVARQPIFSSDRSLYGYELLYRDSDENSYRKDTDGSMATRAVISDTVVAFGLDNLTHGKYAFINFPKSLLMTRFPFLLNPDDFVIELLEDIEEDDALLRQLDELKEKRFLLAMDDYIGQGPQAIVDRADMLKVDFRLAAPETRAQIARDYGSNKQLLAEKVETQAEFEQAVAEGYSLFQGYYFARPTLFHKTLVEIASSTYVRIFREITSRMPDFDNIARIIRLDVNLMYKFLHRINTLEYYRGHRVVSIKHALVRMGLNEIRRWAVLVLLRDAVSPEQDEIVRTALVRGTFAEKLADAIGLDDYGEEAYMVGMFSVIDSSLEEDLPAVLDELCVSGNVKAALLGENTPLNAILRFVKQYEAGDWEEIDRFFHRYVIRKGVVAKFYLEAVQYADIAFDDAAKDTPIRNLRILDALT